jgi:hypothetical protein
MSAKTGSGGCEHGHSSIWRFRNNIGNLRCRLCDGIDHRNRYRMKTIRKLAVGINSPVLLRQLAKELWRHADMVLVEKEVTAIEDRVIWDIIAIAGEYYGLDAELVLTPSRRRPYVDSRQLAAYLLYECTPMSTTEVGEVLQRDHSTIISGLQKTTKAIESDLSFKAQVIRLVTKVQLIAKALADTVETPCHKAETALLATIKPEAGYINGGTNGHSESQI